MKIKTTLFFAFLMVLAIAALIVWLTEYKTDVDTKIIVIIVIGIISLVISFLRWRKRKSAQNKQRVHDDEFVKWARLYGGNQAFYYSMALWLILFAFNSQISDPKTLLGIGILGSAAMYGICQWYFTTTADFDEK